MEVHAPHEPIHSWRDFFIHIATITIGLLIALGLEAMVEWFHHRHVVAEARETLREEIRENHALLQKDLGLLKIADIRLQKNIDLVEQQKAHPGQDIGKLDTSWEWDGMEDSAWQTARETGALALMPYTEVQQYASIYRQQTIVAENASDYLKIYNESFAPLMRTGNGDLSKIPAADLDRLIDGSTHAIAREKHLYWLAVGLDRLYGRALKEH